MLAGIATSSLHSNLRMRRMQALLRARPRIDALEPRIHILQRRIDFLSDTGAEIERREQDDVRDGETIVRDVVLALEQVVEPLEVVLHRRLQPRRGFRDEAHPAVENLLTFREAKSIVKMLGDALLDTALPHARLGALFGIASDQRWIGMLLFEV